MLILWKGYHRTGPRAGPTPSSLRWKRCSGPAPTANIKVVTNAGGLNPSGLADQIRTLADRLGFGGVRGPRRRATTSSPASPSCRQDGHNLAHLDTGRPLDEARGEVISANAYLGGWPIVGGPRGGADVVICPRITDASLVVGPAAWHHGWSPTDWDRLAGAVVAGHVIECGPQATGGNYAFFTEVAGLEHPGLPHRRGGRRRLVGDHQASRHRRPGVGGDGHRPAALRDRRPPRIPTPTWWPASTPSPSNRRGRTGCGSPAPGACRRPVR